MPATIMVKDRSLGKTLMGWVHSHCVAVTQCRLAGTQHSFIIFRGRISGSLGDPGVKCLIVYYVNGQWIGEEVNLETLRQR